MEADLENRLRSLLGELPIQEQLELISKLFEELRMAQRRERDGRERELDSFYASGLADF